MAAQHLDVGVHGAILAVVIVVPHLLQDLLAGEGDAPVGGQEHQQIELLRGEGRLLPVDLHAVAHRVHREAAEGVNAALGFGFGPVSYTHLQGKAGGCAEGLLRHQRGAVQERAGRSGRSARRGRRRCQ